MILFLKALVRSHLREGKPVQSYNRRDAYPPRALIFAGRAHKGQKRKGNSGAAYITHPMGVHDILAHEAGVKDEVVLNAALLHDTIEDTPVTKDDIRAQFGADVAEVVNDVSRPEGVSKEAMIRNLAHKGERTKILKVADRIANLREMVSNDPGWPVEKRQAYIRESELLMEIAKGVHPRLDDLLKDAILQAKAATKA